MPVGPCLRLRAEGPGDPGVGLMDGASVL
jgi:hypothetical protein